jgi:GT2 family glycosyltransferase
MTLAPPRASAARLPAAPAAGSVSAVLVVHDGEPWLVEALDAVAMQSRRPDRLVIIDTGSTDTSPTILRQHAGIRTSIPSVEVLTLGRDVSYGAAVAAGVDALPAGTPGEWIWLLHDDTAPSPLTLDRLVDASRRSASVGVVGPKVTLWDEPRRLRSVGLQYTRTGRASGGPEVGEPDQGQYDGRTDVLGVSSAGMLVRRDVFDELGGFDRSFSGSEDLDLCWRAQLAGHRVVVVPRAVVREGAASAQGDRPGGRSPAAVRRISRRRARQVALTRCSLLATPFLAIWIALSTVVSGLALLLVKRPRLAWREFADLATLFTGPRLLGARWRFRGRRAVRRRDLHGLFVPSRTAMRNTVDRIQDAVTFEGTRAQVKDDPENFETGPVSPDAETMSHLPATWPQRVIRHPGFLAVVIAAVVSVIAWRTALATSALRGSGLGLSGGELNPLQAGPSALWHVWLDGWHGAGLGRAGEAAPYLPVLAGASWLVAHVPWVDPSASPAATAIGWFLVAAMPLSAWSAYLGTRVVTRLRWPRAWAALAWASVGTLTSALDSGRLGATVAHVLLPLVLAGFAVVARRRASAPATFGTVLAVALLGVFNPPLLALSTALALLVVLGGRGWARLRGAILVVVPLALVGPWLLRVLDDPRLLLGGPGLTVWHGDPVAPWHLALLRPEHAELYVVLLAAPLVVAGALGLLRRGPRSPMATALGLLGLVGLTAGLAASRVQVDTVPAHQPGAGDAITPWAGTGLDLLGLALIGAALLGFDAIGTTQARASSRWRSRLGLAVAVVAVAGVVASTSWAGWSGVGGHLRPTADPMPAVAADQAFGPAASRLLVLHREGDTVTYSVQGAEPGDVARGLPQAPDKPAVLAENAVRRTLAGDEAVGGDEVQGALADLGVGFVGLRGDADDPLVRQLDATAGLTRLSDAHGLVLWRVLAQPGSGPLAVQPSRARVLDGDGNPVSALDSTGPHAQLRAEVPAGEQGRVLALAEAPGLADHARVTYDGRVLTPATGTDRPTYRLPASAGTVSVSLETTHRDWRLLQLALLGVTLFLAVPFGNRRSRRAA